MSVQAIQTLYNNYLFRSRLEARWAVFFDAAGIEYQYEPEGYDLGSGEKYLPDFWLTGLKLWVEIKPDTLSDRERKVARLLSEQSRENVLILIGRPQKPTLNDQFKLIEPGYQSKMYWGSFRNPCIPEGVGICHWLESLAEFLLEREFDTPAFFDYTYECAQDLRQGDQTYYRMKYGQEHPHWKDGLTDATQYLFVTRSDGSIGVDDALFGNSKRSNARSEHLMYAYNQSIYARFEHGESRKVQAYDPQIPY